MSWFITNQISAAKSETPQFDVSAVQRRTVTTLLMSQVCGGIGNVSGFAVTALLAYDLTGNATLAGLSAACVQVGATISSFPLVTLMARSGRRPGLRTGYLIASAGALLAAMSAITRIFPLLPLGTTAIGAGLASNLATRYAAADLAPLEQRGRTIGLVVWATTLGSGFGSLISLSVLDPAGRELGLPKYAGSFLTSSVLFLVAAIVIELRLRPDPLIVAAEVDETPQAPLPLARSVRMILRRPEARLAVVAMMISQATMMGTMTLTPLHMQHGHQSGSAISIMLFSHILGMYLLSPVVGLLADRVSEGWMLLSTGSLCVLGALWAGSTPPDGFIGVTAGTTIIGLAWCTGIITGSRLLTSTFPVSQRASIQGAGDLGMTGLGAAAGLAAGGLVAVGTFRTLNLINAGLGALLIVIVVYRQLRTQAPSIVGVAEAWRTVRVAGQFGHVVTAGVGIAQVEVDRADQPGEPLSVEAVLAPEVQTAPRPVEFPPKCGGIDYEE